MVPRRTFTKLACLLTIGPLFIFGIFNLKHFLGVETQISRHRLSIWRKSGYEGFAQYNAQSVSGHGGNLLHGSPSVVEQTKNAPRYDERETKVDTIGNVTNVLNREEIRRALTRLDIARRTMQELLDEQPDSNEERKLKVESEIRTKEAQMKDGYGENKLKSDSQKIRTREALKDGFIEDKLKSDSQKIRTREALKDKFIEQQIKSDTQKTANAIDKLLGTGVEMFDHLEDEAGTDDPLVNADVKRAVPVLKVKRYIDEPTDPHEYNYMYNPSTRCFHSDGRPRPVFVLFLVVTAPGHFERRDLVRHTYGSEKEWPPLKKGVFTTVFLLGKTFNATLQKAIDDEAKTYGDIVQEDFVDTYANLSRKTVMGLKWTTNHCRHASYAMKIDDDSMINQGKFLWIFKSATLKNWTASETLEKSPVFRSNTSKYYISEEYYPDPYYPVYMNGPGYLMSTDLVESSYHMALKTPLFPWEDVFLGTCLQKMEFKPIIHKRFLWISNPEFFANNKENSIISTMRMYVILSNLQPKIMKQMWFSCKLNIVRSH